MLTKASAEAFKDTAPVMIELYPEGAIFGLIEGDTKNKINETIKSSGSNLCASEEQAAATQELTASIEEITSLTTTLEKMARDM